MYALGAAIAFYLGFDVDWGAYGWGQTIVTLTQLMVHYANDYFDLDADLKNVTPIRWSGGSRVLAEGHIPPRVAFVTAVVLGSTAVILTLLLTLIRRPHPLVLAIILPAIGLAWAYSAPPFRLHWRGLGEVSATLIVAVLTPLAGFYLQTGQLSLMPFLAVTPLCLLQFNMLVSVAVPDADSDNLAGKRTLAVRLGHKTMSRLYVALLVAAYALLPLLIWAGLPSTAATVCALTLPLAAYQGWWAWHDLWSDPARWNSIAFLSIALLMGTAILELIAFVGLALR